MEFAYHWVDNTGKIHYTQNMKEADKALHDGSFIELVILDNHHKDGSDRKALEYDEHYTFIDIELNK